MHVFLPKVNSENRFWTFFLSNFKKSKLLSGKKHAKYTPDHNDVKVSYRIFICDCKNL